MKSFSSSAINKSGKKFAPKAPTRRAAPAPAPAAPSRRASAVSQTQAQAAQASQERDVTGSHPPPSDSPAPEQAAVTEDAPVAPSALQESAPSTTKSDTAIPIPRPKRKASVSTPAGQEPVTAISAPDVPTSPRTLPSEPQIIPSIENETEQSEPATARAAVDTPIEDVRSTDEVSVQPEQAPESQTSTSDRAVTRPAKYIKKTSDITKGRGGLSTLATPPASQTLVPTTEGSETPAASVAPSTPEPSRSSTQERKRKASRAGTDPNKPKRVRRKRRDPTPEGAETVEILPNVVKMSELCKDLKTGRKSKRETELRRLELEENERKIKAQEEGLTLPESAKSTAEAEKNKEDRLPAPKPQAGPVMRIVNGEIVLDTASLEVDRHADAARSAGDLEEVVENQLTRKINQATYGKRTKTEVWDEEMTDLFYRGLRMFGTDFMVISKLFPGRSRRQIKLKFNNEERRDPQRIKDTLLGPREVIDITTYSELTNQVYEDPKIIQQELDEEKKRIEEQHEKEKQLQEEMMRNPTGAEADGASNDKANSAPVKGKGRNSKKQNMKNQGGGTEEVLGSIDDIPAA